MTIINLAGDGEVKFHDGPNPVMGGGPGCIERLYCPRCKSLSATGIGIKNECHNCGGTGQLQVLAGTFRGDEIWLDAEWDKERIGG